MTIEEAKEIVRKDPNTFNGATTIHASSTGIFWINQDSKALKELSKDKSFTIFQVKGVETINEITNANGIS